MYTLVNIFTAVSVMSLPLMSIVEWKLGRKRWLKIVHAALSSVGVLTVIIDSLLLNRLASTLRTPDLGDWAKDFYFGCMSAVLPAVIVLTALLCVAALIDHKMRRIRMTVTVLLPFVSVAVLYVFSIFASGGGFPVDLYIRALAAGTALLPHLIPLCERSKKSD